MSKGLVKRIISAVCSLIVLVMLFLVEVSITLTNGKETSTPIKKGYFEFLSDYKKANMYGAARVMMWGGFILVCLCLVYFVFVLVLDLLNKKRLLKKLYLVTKIVGFVVVLAMLFVGAAGLDKEEYSFSNLVNNISLLCFPWLCGVIFSVIPALSDYLIEE